MKQCTLPLMLFFAIGLCYASLADRIPQSPGSNRLFSIIRTIRAWTDSPNPYKADSIMAGANILIRDYDREAGQYSILPLDSLGNVSGGEMYFDTSQIEGNVADHHLDIRFGVLECDRIRNWQSNFSRIEIAESDAKQIFPTDSSGYLKSDPRFKRREFELKHPIPLYHQVSADSPPKLAKFITIKEKSWIEIVNVGRAFGGEGGYPAEWYWVKVFSDSEWTNRYQRLVFAEEHDTSSKEFMGLIQASDLKPEFAVMDTVRQLSLQRQYIDSVMSSARSRGTLPAGYWDSLSVEATRKGWKREE